MFESIVTEHGTLIVPAEMCRELGLQPGDTVTFSTMSDGTVLVTPRSRPSTPSASMEPGDKLRFGFMRGRLTVPDDFDDPLPDDVLRSFGGD